MNYIEETNYIESWLIFRKKRNYIGEYSIRIINYFSPWIRRVYTPAHLYYYNLEGRSFLESLAIRWHDEPADTQHLIDFNINFLQFQDGEPEEIIRAKKELLIKEIIE
jgi:hypothetical protein